MASVDSTATARPSSSAGARLGPEIGLSVSLSIGALLVVAPLVWHLVPVTALPAPLPDHHQDAETLIFIVAFAVLLPMGVFGSAQISNRIAVGPERGRLLGCGGAAERRARAGGRVHQGLRRSALGRWAGGAGRGRRTLVGARSDHAPPRGIVPPLGRFDDGCAPRRLGLGDHGAPAHPGGAVVHPPRVDLRAGVARRRHPRGCGAAPVGAGSTTDPLGMVRRRDRPCARGGAAAGRSQPRRLRLWRPGRAVRQADHPVPPELLPRARQPGPGRRRDVGRRALAVRGRLDLLPRGRLPGGPDQQRHAGADRGWALGAGVRRRVRNAAHRRRLQAARGLGDGRRGARARLRAPVPGRRSAPARRHPLRASGRRDRGCGHRVPLAAGRCSGSRRPAPDRRDRIDLGPRGLRLHVADRARGRGVLHRDPTRRRTPPRAGSLGSAAGRGLSARPSGARGGHARGQWRAAGLGLVPEHAARVPRW